jgi:hypothetical protein
MRLASAAIKSVSSLPRAGGVCSFCAADAVARIGDDSDNTKTLPMSIHVSFGHTAAGQAVIGEVQFNLDVSLQAKEIPREEMVLLRMCSS